MLCRRLAEADIETYRVLRLRALKEHPLDFAADYDEEAAWPLSRWLERLPAAHTFVVEEGGVFVGCASLRILEGRKIRHNAWISACYMTPEARGRGGADALMDQIEAAARDAGATILKLSLRAGNERAERFYRRRGFHVFGHEPVSHIVEDVGYPSLEMWKPLA